MNLVDKILNEDRQYWGSLGAGILPFCTNTQRFLLGKRSRYVNEPGTWAGFGGKVDANEGEEESIEQAAKREFEEETGFSGNITLKKIHIFRDKDFQYHTFLGLLEKEFNPKLDWETEIAKWVTYEELLNINPKHFGLNNILKEIGHLIEKYLIKDSLVETILKESDENLFKPRQVKSREDKINQKLQKLLKNFTPDETKIINRFILKIEKFNDPEEDKLVALENLITLKEKLTYDGWKIILEYISKNVTEGTYSGLELLILAIIDKIELSKGIMNFYNPILTKLLDTKDFIVINNGKKVANVIFNPNNKLNEHYTPQWNDVIKGIKQDEYGFIQRDITKFPLPNQKIYAVSLIKQHIDNCGITLPIKEIDPKKIIPYQKALDCNKPDLLPFAIKLNGSYYIITGKNKISNKWGVNQPLIKVRLLDFDGDNYIFS